MSMSTHVDGFIPPDETFKKMLSIYENCEDVGVDPPKEVAKFFNNYKPDPTGVRVRLEGHQSVKAFSNEFCTGWEIEIASLPKEIKIVRVCNCW